MCCYAACEKEVNSTIATKTKKPRPQRGAQRIPIGKPTVKHKSKKDKQKSRRIKHRDLVREENNEGK